MNRPGPDRSSDPVSREVDAEVTAHLQMQIADLQAAGLSEDAALREALRRFGPVDDITRELRRLRRQREARMRRFEVVHGLRQDVRLGLRQLKRKPGFAVAAILILGLGIGATAAVFSVVDGALLRPLPFPDPERMVLVWEGDETGQVSSVSYPDFQDWEREQTFLSAIATRYFTSYTVATPTGPVRVPGAVVDGDVLGVAGLPPIRGRGFIEQDYDSGERVAMLAEAFWTERYARGDVTGQTITLNGQPHTIVGVMPTEIALMTEAGAVAVYVPLIEEPWMSRGLHFLRVYGRLEPGLGRERAQAHASVLSQGLIEAGVPIENAHLQSLRDRLVGDTRPLMLVLAGAVAFLMLIVCANLANLVLSQATSRVKEFAVRSALGAGRQRLVRQMIAETLTLGVGGGIVGLLLARLGARQISGAAERAAVLVPDSFIDLRVVAFTALVSLGTGLAFGLVPAMRASGQDVAQTLKDGAGRVTGGRAAWRSRRMLVGAEIALSVVLLAGAGLMVRSVVEILNQDPGFDPDGVLTFAVSLPETAYESDEARTRFWDDLLVRLRGLPGVRSAAASSRIPLEGGDTSGGFRVVGREYDPEHPPITKKRIATPGYFEAMGIPILRGRDFDGHAGQGNANVAIVSEALANQYWPGEDPVGQQLEFRWGTEGAQEIIGVVGDVKHNGLDLDVGGTAYVPHFLFAQSGLTVVVRTAVDPGRLVPAVRREVLAIDPQQPIYDVLTLETVMRASVATRRTFMTMLMGFAGVALVLAAVGVYAITTQSVAARTREIGIRMAVGADAGRVLGMVMGEEGRTVSIGLAIGLGAAALLTRALEALLFGVTASDPLTFAAVTLGLAAVGLVAALIPAVRATRVNPTTALRTGG